MKTNKTNRTAVLPALLLGAILLAGCVVHLEHDPPDPHYVAVESIDGVPTGGVKNFALILSRSVSPDNATNQDIVWSIVNDGGTNSTLDRDVLSPKAKGTITMRAVIKNGGKTRADDYTQDFEIEILDVFYSVTNIINIPTECDIGVPLTLTGTVRPSNATNKTITWTVKDAGGTNTVITNGNTLTASSNGTVIVTAIVQGGKMPSTAYTQDFAIDIK